MLTPAQGAPVGNDPPPELLPDTFSWDPTPTLGGCPLDELASRHGTPLYVFDEETVRASARAAMDAFAALNARVSFACKACETPLVLDMLRREGVSLDVVSGGEIEVGLRSGFRPNQLHLHGNAKSTEELTRAVQLGIRAVVVDNMDELQALAALVGKAEGVVPIQLRVTLPLQANTHPHLQTSGVRSKFGFGTSGTDLQEAVSLVRSNPRLDCNGLHIHLGSQISESGLYATAARALIQVADEMRSGGVRIRELSLGGGWAVPYCPGDPQLGPGVLAGALAPIFKASAYRLALEPGRALVARAGLALYRVRSVKESAGRRIVAVDGGMADNPRPSLYGSRYTAFTIARRASARGHWQSDIVGRYCESGDTLIRDTLLGNVAPGDLLCVPVAGAYHLPMAYSYNLVPQPAVIVVGDGSARLATRRQTLDDLLDRQVFPPGDDPN